MKYTQCTLQKQDKETTTTLQQVSWIPTKYAILFTILKLKDDNGIWDNGWKVVGVGATLHENLIHDTHVAIKEHRKRTGDSLPKKGS